MTSHQSDTDQIYFYTNNQYEHNIIIITKCKSINLEHCNLYKTFIEYSNDMDYIYENIDEYNANKKYKILIVLDHMIVDILSNKKLQPIEKKLFIKIGKINIFLSLSHNRDFSVQQNIILNSIHYFIMKFQKKEIFNKSQLIIC